MHHPVNPTCRVMLRGLIAEFGLPEVREAMKSRSIARLNEVEPRRQWTVLHDVLKELDNPKPVEPPKPTRDPADVKMIEALRGTIQSHHATTCRLLDDLAKTERELYLLQAKEQGRGWLGRLFKF